MSQAPSYLKRSAKTYSASDIDARYKSEEVLIREGYAGIVLHDQIGFELPGLKLLVENFIKTDRREEKSMPLGWFVTFFEKNEDGSIKERAEKISEIKIKELNLYIYRDDPEVLINIGDNWMETLSNATGILDLVDLDLDPSPVKILQVENDTSNQFPLSSFNSDGKDLRVLVETISVTEPLEGNVFNILGYRPDLRVAYLDYNTIFQMYLAYNSDPDNADMKFVFTGAEINYGEMVNPSLQTERFKDWNNPATDLDPSICSTLKIELLSHKNENNYYVSGDLHAGIQSVKKLSLPGVFILPSCRRFWETVNQIRSSVIEGRNVFYDPKKANALMGIQRFTNAVTVDSIKNLVDNGESVIIQQ